MEGLQRSTTSFRRQGSSGIVWDDRLIAELNKQANEQKDESQRDEQPKPMSESSEQGKPIAGDEKDKLRPIKTGLPEPGGIERSRSNGGGAPRHHRATGRVSPAVDPPSPRVSTCGCCSAFGKKPPGKKNNPRKRPPKRRSR
ncbi:hypothetical protein EUTSA_v10009053mg [Eutrema salsugineum]|uniref:MAPK kinase substrate protein n=1 Tax=Eutrema salsugineum TaxID=72664 RepID=V4L681_EUTSA|nr:uncharacterized protein At1g15400 [Eutrema salsugineum]ESQ35263.1 hypothetical protein EUTSA_v10009053mg [Eutrema salsugineum]